MHARQGCGRNNYSLAASNLFQKLCGYQATSVGQAVAGFGVSVLSFLTLWAAPGMEPGEVRRPADVAGAATAYFGLSATVMAVSVGGYWWLQHLPFWHFHTRAAISWEGNCACMPIYDFDPFWPFWKVSMHAAPFYCVGAESIYCRRPMRFRWPIETRKPW